MTVNRAAGPNSSKYAPTSSAATIEVIGHTGSPLRLLKLYESMIGVLQPILDMESLEAQVRRLYSGTSSENDNGAIEVLNMALAIALLAEGEGSSDKAATLYNCSHNVME